MTTRVALTVLVILAAVAAAVTFTVLHDRGKNFDWPLCGPVSSCHTAR